MKEILSGLPLLYCLAVLCMVLVLVAMAVDLVSGWHKAKLRGEMRTSYGFSRSLTKFLIYEGILLISCCIDTLLHVAWTQFSDTAYSVPMVTVVMAVVLCGVEAWSVREKAEEKTRNRIDKALAVIVDAIGKDKAAELIREALEGKNKPV